MQEKINSNYLNAPKVNTLKTRETVKTRKKEEPIDLDSFDDLREFLNLAKVMKEEIEVSKKTERIHIRQSSELSPPVTCLWNCGCPSHSIFTHRGNFVCLSIRIIFSSTQAKRLFATGGG